MRKTYPDHYSKGDFVFFLHIPKTAGTSVSETLRPVFPEDRILTHDQINNVRAHDPSVYLNARFFYGHFTHEVYGKRLPKQPDFILTFVRNPVAHYVSTYFHLKVDPTFTFTTRLCPDISLAEEIHQFVKDRPLEEFFTYEHAHLFDNYQTRYLARGLSSDFDDKSDTELLPIAQRLLIDLPFFGITERMGDSLEMLKAVMRTDNELVESSANGARNKPVKYSLSKGTLRKVRDRTAADQKLYTFATDVFEGRYRALDPHRQQGSETTCSSKINGWFSGTRPAQGKGRP